MGFGHISGRLTGPCPTHGGMNAEALQRLRHPAAVQYVVQHWQ